MKEFKTVRGRFPKSDKAGTFGFQYRFALPLSGKDLRSRELFKVVKTEYLLHNLVSLVGNVGGILGVFVGFSFLSLVEWMLKIGQEIWKQSKSDWCNKARWTTNN